MATLLYQGYITIPVEWGAIRVACFKSDENSQNDGTMGIPPGRKEIISTGAIEASCLSANSNSEAPFGLLLPEVGANYIEPVNLTDGSGYSIAYNPPTSSGTTSLNLYAATKNLVSTNNRRYSLSAPSGTPSFSIPIRIETADGYFYFDDINIGLKRTDIGGYAQYASVISPNGRPAQTAGYAVVDYEYFTEYLGQLPYIGLKTIYSDMEEWAEEYTPVKPSADPYKSGGESETGGGTGDFDGTSDPVDFPQLPSISSVDAGFITLFNPSTSQLKALASYMWSNSLFDLDTWKKIFADPMDAILGLTIVPVDVPSGGSGPVTVGNIPTDINMTYASSQYVEVDCGTLNVNEYWGAYLDYEPFTKAEIYLPYIGTHAISVDDIMNKEVHVKYHIDILSGACAAYVKCGDSVLYTFIGQCASSIPISGSDMTNVINGVISAAVSIGSMVATGGASAPLAAPALANTAVNHMKPNIEKSGSMSGTGGLLAIQTPYLILTRPRQCLPAAQNEYMGYPAFISKVLGDVSGYTEVEQVHLDGIAATEAEITEIENLLKSGVIL